MNAPTRTKVSVNDRSYPWPLRPAIAICLDGCEPAYLEVAIAAGQMPNLARIRQTGSDRLAHSVIPSFTNPNNLSIATGCPPAVHGICGNYLFEPETGEEVMMNDVRFLRAPTVFAAFQQAGAKVAIVTAKDQAAGAARRRADPWRRGGDLLLLGKIRYHHPGRTWGRHGQPLAGPSGARGLFGGTIGIRVCRRGQAAARAATGPDVSDHHRLCAAQIRPRGCRGAGV